MAGRARGDEGVGRLAGNHRVHRRHGAADPMHGRLEAFRAENRVVLDAHETFFRDHLGDRLDIAFRMTAIDRLQRAFGRLFPVQEVEALVFQHLRDRSNAIGALGMTGPGQMFGEDRMVIKARQHGRDLERPVPLGNLSALLLIFRHRLVGHLAKEPLSAPKPVWAAADAPDNALCIACITMISLTLNGRLRSSFHGQKVHGDGAVGR